MQIPKKKISIDTHFHRQKSLIYIEMSNCEHACPQPQSEKSILMVTYFAKFQNKKKWKSSELETVKHTKTHYTNQIYTQKKKTHSKHYTNKNKTFKHPHTQKYAYLPKHTNNLSNEKKTSLSIVNTFSLIIAIFLSSHPMKCILAPFNFNRCMCMYNLLFLSALLFISI